MLGNIDSARLRSTLDQLREALARPIVVPSFRRGANLIHDSQALAARLGPIIEGLRGRDFTALRTQSALHRGLNAEHGDRLRHTVQALHCAWHSLVLHAMGPERVAALHALLGAATPDLLSIFGKQEDENTHSDVLRWLLDPRCARRTAPPALSAIVRRLEQSARWASLLADAIDRDLLSVRREVILGREGIGDERSGRIDLLITGPDFALAVENKVRSMEHEGQTEAYARWLDALPVPTAGIFLTPSGLPPRSHRFVAMSYLDLVGCLLEGAAIEPLPPEEAYVLSGYLKTLRLRILNAELRNLTKQEA